MSRYHHNKVTHELEPIAGYGSRVATSVDGKTLTVHSSILNIDGYNYGEGDIGTAIQMIAPIESSLVASKAYAAGDQFVYNGLLYKVTAAIASGGAIVIGTNASLADSVTEQINDAIKWLDGGNVNGGTVLKLPTATWTELWLEFSLYSNPKIMLSLLISKNTRTEKHFSVCGYLSQTEITAASYTGITPHLLWIDVYSHGDNLLMLEANSEDTINNYNMHAFYKK